VSNGNRLIQPSDDWRQSLVEILIGDENLKVRIFLSNDR